ncbi:MAG: NnrS family protein [Rhodoferax sp.]|nr:NnrS family protein [Rhodoferax sp.]
MTGPILNLLEPGSQRPHGMPLLRLGFRPFYLCAAMLAALAVPVWVAVFLGYLQWTPVINPLLWHAHEMLFGFASAVIIGFLLTAGKAWTGLGTTRGPQLGALVLLWLAARVAALAAPYPVYALFDGLLLPIVTVVLVRLLLRARNTRNLPIGAMVGALALANAAFHAVQLGWWDLPPLQPLHAGLALIVMIECVMAGRVIPGFTMSALPGVKIKTLAWLDRATLTTTALGLLLWVLEAPALAAFPLLATASVLHLVRQWRWQPWRTHERPILWILHAAYAWITIGLALLALAAMGWVAASAGLHALAVGATGGLIIGMMTRTARGHTGRLLKVSMAEVAAYALVLLAAVLRVIVPMASGALLVPAYIGAAAAWSAAFLIYLWIYTPWLTQTRLDGRDG